jgi:hypothetical protein
MPGRIEKEQDNMVSGDRTGVVPHGLLSIGSGIVPTSMSQKRRVVEGKAREDSQP